MASDADPSPPDARAEYDAQLAARLAALLVAAWRWRHVGAAEAVKAETAAAPEENPAA